MNKYGIPGLQNPEIMEFRDFDNEIGIWLDQSEAEKYIKLLNLLINNIFHKIVPICVRRLAARP